MTEQWKRYSTDLLAAKVQWEGGVIGALEWGLRSEDIADESLAAQWLALENAYEVLRPLVRSMQQRLSSRPQERVE